MSRRAATATALALLVLLAAAWLLWSGIYKPLLLWLGAFSCALTVYIAHRVGFFERASGLHVIPKLPGLSIWLLAEIVKSSVEVVRLILDPKLPISPTVVYLDAEPEGSVGQVILANSITLTPGTVTLDVFEDRLCVHCLTREGAEALQAGDANRRIARVTSQ
ncbi:MAG: Na+/H+ antiporter subunit E [Woeseiaceae bacterium]|jgi:multicomponent Na+:H+ antiporter subunit E